jgi:hypothetical protein
VDLSVTRKLRAVSQLEHSGGPHMTLSSADQDRRHDTVVFDHRGSAQLQSARPNHIPRHGNVCGISFYERITPSN